MLDFSLLQTAFFLLLGVFGLCVSVLCIIVIISMFFERDFSIFLEIFIMLLISVLFAFLGFSFFEEPPETIERNGYTYTIYEEPPEEFIEYNGHTYRLGDSVNE